MAITLNTLKDNPGARRKTKLLGRGIGSGKGKTSGRGGKGQTARSGVAINGFEGGQTPIHRRLPKRGFFNPLRLRFQSVNTGRIQKFIDAGKLNAKSAINAESLIAAGVIRKRRDGIKLLAKGELKVAATIEVNFASKSAIAQVEKVGGKVNLIDVKPKKAEGEKAAKSEKKAAKAPKAKKTSTKE